MTLNQLNYFVATCNNGQNMTNAAKSLFVTQSAISCAIKELEEEFQLKLFVRGKKNLYLTEEGKQFYQMALQVLADVEKLAETFRPSSREGTALRVGMTALTANLFSGVLGELEAEHPEQRVHLSIFQSPKLRELVRQGILDVAVVGWDIADGDSGDQTRILGSDRCTLYIRRDHPLAAEKEVRAEQLAELPVCYYFDNEALIPAPGAPLVIEQFIPGLKLNKVQVETTFLSTVHEFVSEGKGGAILAGGIRFEDDDICQVKIQRTHPFQIAAVWRRGQPLSQAGEELLERVQKTLTDMD